MMKSPSPANKSAPKARVMRQKPAIYFCDSPSGIYLELSTYAQTPRHYPVLVRPCPSRKKAAQLARFANLTWEEKVERVARAIFEEERFSFSKGPWNYLSGEALERYLRKGRAALAALGEQPDKGESEA